MPVDIYQYIVDRSEPNAAPDSFKCMEALRQTIAEYWNSSFGDEAPTSTNELTNEPHCKELLTKEPWLMSFVIEQQADVTPAMLALSRSANTCTLSLLQLITLLSNTIIMSDWKVNALKIFPYTQELSGDRISALIHDQITQRSNDVRYLWRDLRSSAQSFRTHKAFQTLSARVASFCLQAGCPTVSHRPREDVFALRQHLFHNDGAVREAELRAQIEELRSANRAQARIITNLGFRHLLESLPGKHTGTGSSATAQWNAFFSTALKEAQAQAAQGVMGHPFAPLLKKYPWVKQVEDTGTRLYGTLSTNIHHFAGQYIVSDDQWNVLEADILRALVPLPQNLTAAGVDWDQERLRY